MYRNLEKPNERGVKEQKYGFSKGTTPWTKERIREMIVREGGSAAFPSPIKMGLWRLTDHAQMSSRSEKGP